MFEALLVDQNPHWQNNALYTAGKPRSIFPKLIEYLGVPHVISLIGVRRCGKSTLLKQLINYLLTALKVPTQNILFINLENPYFLPHQNDPTLLQKIYEDYLKLAKPVDGMIYCLLDEVQFITHWPIFVKSRYENKNIKFVITGSNSQLLSNDLLTALSGRTLPLMVYPLSFQELLSSHTIAFETALDRITHDGVINEILQAYLQNGGFPEIVDLSNKGLAHDILNAYAKSILYEDVAKRIKAKKPIMLERMFFYLISNISSLFTYNKLSILFDLNDKTIKEYIFACQEAFLIFQVEEFSYSVKKQIRSPKKIYAIDVGFFNAMAFKFSENIGKIIENVVFISLKMRYEHVFYYKTKSGFEVDFVVQSGKNIRCIQVTLTLQDPKIKTRELRALIEAMQFFKIKHGYIVTLEESAEFIEGDHVIHLIPLKDFLLQELEPS